MRQQTALVCEHVRSNSNWKANFVRESNKINWQKLQGKGRELVSYLLAANLQLTANGFIWRLVDNLRAIGLSVCQGGGG